MNVTTYVNEFIAKMNTVNNIDGAKALIERMVKDCGSTQVVSLVTALVFGKVDDADGKALLALVGAACPAADLHTGNAIATALWLYGNEYEMGTELLIPSMESQRAEFDKKYKAAVAEMNELHEKNVKEMHEEHARNVAAMRARFFN